MIKDLKSQLGRMTFVLFLMVSLGVWQLDFVISAVKSNVFLNLTIFGTFFFGAFLMYRDVMKLENEIHAFEALKEEFEDTRNVADKEANDPLWRYYRCNELATIYKKPTILGHAHQLISEQIARHKSLSISPSTMSTLVDGVDGRLADQKSLQQYVTGILVFLGLIGTFVGLMATLASVGDILGALDLTSGDAMAVVAKLMDNLQKPLKGMATGFSSSLFGLVTSLTLGVMGRFAAKASNDLRTNFEEWLAGVAQIDENAHAADEELEAISNGTNGVSARQLQLLYKVARHTMTNNGRVRNQMETLTSAVQSMVEQQQKDQRNSDAMLTSLSSMAQQQASMVQVLDRSSRAMQSRYDLKDLMAHMEDRLADRQECMRNRIDAVNQNLNTLALSIETQSSLNDQDGSEANELINELDKGALDLHQQMLLEHKEALSGDEVSSQSDSDMNDQDMALRSQLKLTLKRQDNVTINTKDPLELGNLKERLSEEFEAEIREDDHGPNPSDRWDLHQLMQEEEQQKRIQNGTLNIATKSAG